MRLFLVIVSLFWLAAGGAQPAAAKSGLRDLIGRSIAVEAVALDGDTLLIVGAPRPVTPPDGVEAGLKPGKTRIRLWGIDTPEHDTREGLAALYALDDLLASAPAAHTPGAALVTCEVLDVDRYKRLVADCRADSFVLAERMLSWGLATVYRAFAWADPAQRTRAARYDALQAEARAAGRGLWAGLGR